MTPAVGRRKTNGRNDTEGHRRTIAVRKENIYGTTGTCRKRLSARTSRLTRRVDMGEQMGYILAIVRPGSTQDFTD